VSAAFAVKRFHVERYSKKAPRNAIVKIDKLVALGV